jgi:hypothetical protein
MLLRIMNLLIKKTGGLSTKASRNWLDQQLNWTFKYQGVNTLIRPMGFPKKYMIAERWVMFIPSLRVC